MSSQMESQAHMHCRICIKEPIDQSWQDWFEGLQIKREGTGTTTLEGELRDQAALYGVLFTIRQLGLTLLSCETDEAHPPEK